MPPPLIGITTDLVGGRYRVAAAYASSVSRAGAVPVLLPCLVERARDLVRRCDGIILSGGDDPIMERWGTPTHPEARPIDPQRQAFELTVLAVLDEHVETPVLGVCLGMQLMGLHRGGALDQFLPESLSTAGRHWPTTCHPVEGELGAGRVESHHRQALADAGSLRIAATAPDGVIEAIVDDRRTFYVGVQWHPERTGDERLGVGLFRGLVKAAERRCRAPFSPRV